MKTVLKTIACSLLIAGSVSAQTITDKAKIMTVKEYELNNEKTITIKTTSTEQRDFTFDSNDAGQQNQNLIGAPVQVKKTIMIDYDNDDQFDKEVELTYQKHTGEDLNYVATPDGLYITSSDSTPLFIQEPGAYELDSKNIDNVMIVVENLNTIKSK